MKIIDKLIENFLDTGKIISEDNEVQNLQNLQAINDLLDRGDGYKKKNNFPLAVKYWQQGVDLYDELDEPSLLSDRVKDIEIQIRNFSNLLPKKEPIVDLGGTEEPPKEDPDVEVISNKEDPKEEKKDVESLSKEIGDIDVEEIEFSDATKDILHGFEADKTEKEEYQEVIKTLENEVGELNKKIKYTGKGEERDNLITKKNELEDDLEEYKNELLNMNKPILNSLLNNRCLINTIIDAGPKRRELVDFLNRRFGILKDFRHGDTYYEIHKNSSFITKLGKEYPHDINKVIRILDQYGKGGRSPEDSKQYDNPNDYCGVEFFDKSKIINQKQEEVHNEYTPQNEQEDLEIKRLLDKAFNLVNIIFNQFVKNDYLKQKYAKTTRYNKLIDVIKNYWSGDNYKDRHYSLLNIIYDLNQLLVMVKSFRPEDKKLFDRLINNIYNNVNDSDIIRNNFIEIRENNNLKYEKSFECEDGKYFEYSSGGDTSAILGAGIKNNQILKNMMNKIIVSIIEDGATYSIKNPNGEDIKYDTLEFINNQSFKIGEGYLTDFSKTPRYSDKIKWCVEKLYENIKPDDVDKYDIISNRKRSVIVGEGNNTLKIEPGSKIEVKDSDSREYHLSEFFGIYKDSKLPLGYKKIPQYREIYNDIINGLYEKIKSEGDKGILDKISVNTKGIFFRGYKYIPLERNMLSWSLDGQRSVSEGLPEYRLSVRVNMEDQTEYLWTSENGNCNLETERKDESTENTDHISEYVNKLLDL